MAAVLNSARPLNNQASERANQFVLYYFEDGGGSGTFIQDSHAIPGNTRTRPTLMKQVGKVQLMPGLDGA